MDCLDAVSCWNEPTYTLTLELKITLAETEKMLGHNEQALEMAEEIFRHARSLGDKSRVHHCYAEATNSKNHSNYSSSVDTALEILKLYNIDVPSEPSKGQVKSEKLMFRMALRDRSLLCITKFPIATDPIEDRQILLAARTYLYALFGRRGNVALVLGYRMLRIILRNKTITKEVPSLLVSMGAQLRESRKYESAFLFASVAMGLMERFRLERGHGVFRAKMGLYVTLFCLRETFRDCIETYLDLNKWGYSTGDTENGVGAGMCAMYAFMIASLPLNALFEPKLMLFEEMAVSRGRENFAVIFRLIRQYLYNLEGGEKASPVPSQINGKAISEEEAMGMFEEGSIRKQTNRDIGMIRLELSVIFDDQQGMEEMLNRLDEYPPQDVLTVRQHLRLTYMGLASLILLLPNQKSKRSDPRLGNAEKWSKLSFQFFEELARFGSPNAQPVYSCMKALRKPNIALFDEAIQMCGNAGLLNLAAIMNERCGLLLQQGHMSLGNHANKSPRKNTKTSDGTGLSYETYLKCAIWCYHDWGAMGKVAQLKSRFDCLTNACRKRLLRNSAWFGDKRPN